MTAAPLPCPLATRLYHARGQEGARGAQADVHAELGEQQYVGAADAAVGAVTEDKQVFALEGVPVVSPDLT